MDHEEIRRIRGSLSRTAFARLLGVTSLTVLRWELPEDSKEARRPRPKMVEAIRRLVAEGLPAGEGADDGDDDDLDVSEAPSRVDAAEPAAPEVAPDSEQRRLAPLLDQLCTEQWRRAEEHLTGLLTSEGLTTRFGRILATLGLVQVQVLAHMDLRGALAVLVPILDEAKRGDLPAAVAGRAHVMATLVFSAPDSRVHDLGRVNAHAARAASLLPVEANDLHVQSATSCIAAARYLGPEVTLHAYQAHLEHLNRARSPLARLLADALAGLIATVRGDAEASARLGGRALEACESMGHWGLVMGILSDYAHRTLRGSRTPDAVLEITRHARECATAASLVPTEGYIRVLSAECEALCRLARFDEARRTAEEALSLAERHGLARFSLTAPIVRLCLLTDERGELDTLAARYEQDDNGPLRNGIHLHASYARGVSAYMSGDFETACEALEVVCTASDSTLGIEYIVLDAHHQITLARLAARDIEGARGALRRFEDVLELRESVWHGTMARRAEALIMIERGEHSEARSRLESTVATFTLLGDAVESRLGARSSALLAVAAGAPNATRDAQAALEGLLALGVSAAFVERATSGLARSFDGGWREQTMAERLVVAMERLGVKGLEPSAFRRELAAVLCFLFPDREALVGGSELAERETTVEVPGEKDEPLRFGVRGRVDEEQRAVLALLAGIVASRPTAMSNPREPDLDLSDTLKDFIAASPGTRELKRDILRLSRSSATILISGESGSGKEVVARAVHDVSARAGKPYVTLNCASVPRDLFEGQLFGYRKGAFTGATTDNPGVIRAADGGTLFLDEIGELPIEMQPKLLRFLENGEVQTLGEIRPRRVDVRVVAATHRDLDRLVRDGQFREDLYYRLNVVPIQVPPLRDRREDVIALARLFVGRLTEAGSVPPVLGRSATRALQAHTWPGNVRELRNVIERAMAYSPVPSELQAEHLRLMGV